MNFTDEDYLQFRVNISALILFFFKPCISLENCRNNLLFQKILPRAFNHAIFHAVVHKDTQWDIRLHVNIFDKDGVASWVSAFTALSQTYWAVRSTPSVKGKTVVFKRRYGCIHAGRFRHKVNTETTPNRRNTNCPAILQFVVSAAKSKSRAKKKNDPKMPCEIYLRLSHNHPLQSSDALRFRPLSTDVKEKLRMLFRSGHTAATALESIKIEIQDQHPDNFDIFLADRSKCPDYQSCYRLYMKEFEKDFGHINNTNNDFLIKRLMKYNQECEQECASWEFTPEETIIAICTPLMKRAHKNTPQSSEIVFIDSSGTVDKDGHRIFILLTHNESGGVPLGVIISSSEAAVTLKKALAMLKALVGADGFFSAAEGPAIFMTDDSDSERNSLGAVWPNAVLLLCLFHILQAMWRWLQKGSHGVAKNDRPTLYHHFKQIAYAQTEDQCSEKYEAMLMDPTVCKYKTFLKHIALR
jgi:hypothetical protein